MINFKKLKKFYSFCKKSKIKTINKMLFFFPLLTKINYIYYEIVYKMCWSNKENHRCGKDYYQKMIIFLLSFRVDSFISKINRFFVFTAYARIKSSQSVGKCMPKETHQKESNIWIILVKVSFILDPYLYINTFQAWVKCNIFCTTADTLFFRIILLKILKI